MRCSCQSRMLTHTFAILAHSKCVNEIPTHANFVRMAQNLVFDLPLADPLCVKRGGYTRQSCNGCWPNPLYRDEDESCEGAARAGGITRSRLRRKCYNGLGSAPTSCSRQQTFRMRTVCLQGEACGKEKPTWQQRLEQERSSEAFVMDFYPSHVD